jgi:DNA transposition AAA+ family ATPase
MSNSTTKNPHRSEFNEFLVTKEYKRFVEFCEACRRYRYIGLCYGPPGVGKTLSARHYTLHDVVEPYRYLYARKKPLPLELAECRSLLYTPDVTNTPRQIENQIISSSSQVSILVEEAINLKCPQAETAEAQSTEEYLPYTWESSPIELILVDEADRLKVGGLEQIRALYDRSGLGVILIGMPGLEKRLSRYPQLYSRVGFVHQFKTLSNEELKFILEQKWSQLGLSFNPNDFTDAEAIAAIIRITNGNFRLLQRLCAQIERILQINELQTITKEVVEAAREGLVIGAT